MRPAFCIWWRTQWNISGPAGPSAYSWTGDGQRSGRRTMNHPARTWPRAPAGNSASIERFVYEWLGTLMDYAAAHGAQLVMTLNEYLECGIIMTPPPERSRSTPAR